MRSERRSLALRLGARSRHQVDSIDWAVEKHREGDNAQAQGQHGKDETDPGSISDQLPALRRVEDSRDELREG